METYYFIQKNSEKKGPFKISDLKAEFLSPNSLVWRNDSDTWKSASEYEELKDIIFIEPPLTPKETKIKEFQSKHSMNIIRNTIISYFGISIFFGFFSYSIAISSWENYLKDTESKYVPSINKNYDKEFPSDGTVMLIELLDNKRYPMYQRGVNLENIYGLQQGMFFRFSKAYFSNIYLTREEQSNYGNLLSNIIISSLISLFPFFLIFGLVIYYSKRKNIINN